MPFYLNFSVFFASKYTYIILCSVEKMFSDIIHIYIIIYIIKKFVLERKHLSSVSLTVV